MPFINTKVSIPIDREKEKLLKESFGKAITALGKSEHWLMLNFEDNCRMWFRGKNNSPLAMVEVSLFGKASAQQYNSMTAQISGAITQILGIPSDGIYVKYSEIDTWGLGNSNF